MRVYFIQEMAPAGVVGRFGYSAASVHQMAALLRAGKLALFAPVQARAQGAARKATGELHERVLALRATQHSISEIAAALTTACLPVSTQTVWQILLRRGAGAATTPRRGPPG